jgi:uncharacterized membrane protein
MNSPNSQSTGFDFNYPTIISLCYIASYVTGVTAVVGLVLAYIWRGENPNGWEASHYSFHIRTFWIGFAGFVVGFLTMLIGIGVLIMFAVGIWMLIRSVVALLKAQKKEPMPNPETLFI